MSHSIKPYLNLIWGVICLGLIAFAVFRALSARRENPRLRATGWWISLGGLANSTWIFLWHYKHFPLTLAAAFFMRQPVRNPDAAA